MEKETLPQKLHFVGIAGIGMSGVAQAAAALGLRVTGSDRAIHAPENKEILDSLKAQGIRLYEQNGSVYQDGTPDALVISSAIESGNPDFRDGIPQIHRSKAITMILNAMSSRHLYAVAGTSGKTTVSAWLTEALHHLGADPGSLCGGLMNQFHTEKYCGNFLAGKGDPFVIEADESDKSLLNYTPHGTILLNIGTDHYSREELADVFGQFIRSAKGPSVVEEKAFTEMGMARLAGKKITVFSGNPDAPDQIEGCPVRKINSWRVENGRYYCAFDGLREIALPVPGFHSAMNALAVYSLLRDMGYEAEESLNAVSRFSGVWRRFDAATPISTGAAVYDDYAHNVEKLRSALTTAQALTRGRVFMIFQPHGFKPLGFMRDELYAMLDKYLHPDDRFCFLPVFYAGGTTSFKPSAEEVTADFQKRSGNNEKYAFFPDRESVEKMLKNETKSSDIVLITGARDNSLSIWAKKLHITA